MSVGAVVAIVAGVVVLAVCGVCAGTGLAPGLFNGKPGAAPAGVTGPPAPSVYGHTIRFKVNAAAGTATMVNWSTLEDSAVEKNVATPWSKDVQLDQRAGLVGVNASATGRVTCRLVVDGKIVDEGDSDGVVNCSATIS